MYISNSKPPELLLRVIVIIVSCGLFMRVAPRHSNKVAALTISQHAAGTAINFGPFKWVKLSSSVAGTSYWMMGENYCSHSSGGGCTGANSQIWDNTSSSNWNRPATINTFLTTTVLSKFNATEQSYMQSVAWTSGYNGAESSQTYTAKISLVSHSEWNSYRYVFCTGRFGRSCTWSDFANWWPWQRTAVDPNIALNSAWLIGSPTQPNDPDGGNPNWYGVTNTAPGFSPVVYLDARLYPSSGAGTYASPYNLSLDTTNPTLTFNNSNTTYYNIARATITASDAHAGLLTIRYAWSTGTGNPSGISTSACTGGANLTGFTAGQTTAWTNSTALTPTNQGVNYLHVCVMDSGGNITKSHAQYNYDTTLPTFTLSPAPTGTSSYLTTNQLTITRTDAHSGVVETRYSTTNNLNSACTSGGSVYSSAITLSAGTNNIYVCVRDNAGNVSTSHSAYNAANIYQVNRDATHPTDPTVENSADPSIGAFASYVSGYSSLTLAGTVNDSDIGQTLTIQYQIDGIAGSWSNLTTLTANGSNQSWSGVVNLPSGLTAGSHTIYLRVYDGYAYSVNKTVNFVLDLSAPTNTVSLIGGVLCTGIPTIYCTPPTGINLAASSDNAAGIGAYRTQWETIFAAGDVAPAWVIGTPPSNITTTGHTTAAATHTLYYQTRDTVGNASAVESISYYVNAAPEITLKDANHNRIVSPYTPLVFSGTFTDSDLSQTAFIKATIDGIDYVSQTYPTTGGTVSWELVILFSSLHGLSPTELTNLPIIVTDSAGASSSTYYTGQITLSSSTSSEIYLSVIKNIPFSLTIGKVGAFNITFGTNQGITVSTNSSDEIIVSGSLSSPVSIPFGITTLVFTVLEEPSFEVQNIEFI